MEELRQLGRYQLTRVLGRGAMGVVYEGIDPKLNRQIALKTILKGHISDPEVEAEYSARFIREAQAVARLNHPNIVTVFDFGEENDIAFIVMECIRGDELKTYFDEKREFSLEDSVRMTGELLDALDYAHQNGIVHRDIKPANVMLDGQNRVKLTDFGVARLSDTNAERTQAGTMVGTPSYMSPEQIEGSAVGPRSDIFAVGIILYQFLTGEKPFHANGMWAIQKKIMQEDPVLPSVMNPAISPAFDAVILRALAKKPDDRYATAHDFKKDLQRALAGEALEDLDATRMVIRPRATSNAIGAAGDGSGTGAGLRASEPGTGTGSGTRGGATNPADASGTAGLEIEFWRSIKDSNDVEEIEAYMKRFPGGVYTELAQRKLAKLRGESTSTVPPSTDEDDATRMVPVGPRPQLKPGQAANPNPPSIQAPAPAPAPAASGNKMLVPGIAAGVVALAGIAYFALGGKETPAPVSTPSTTPISAPSSVPSPIASPTPAAPAASAAASVQEEQRLAAEKAAAEKAAADKAAADKAAQQEAERVKAEQAKKDLAKTPEEKKKLELEEKKKAEEKAKKLEEEAAKKKAAEEARKLAADEAAKKKAQEDAAKKQAAEEAKKKQDEEAAKAKAAAEAKAKQEAAAAAAAATPAAPAPAAGMSASAMRAEAASLESQGKMREAVKMYKQAANAGDGEAAKRLGNIYGKGEGGIARDYAESVKWNDIARKRGIDIPKGDKL